MKSTTLIQNLVNELDINSEEPAKVEEQVPVKSIKEEWINKILFVS